MATPAKPIRFENLDSSITVTFPLVDLEFDDDLPLITAPVRGVGVDYAFDALRFGLAPVGVRSIRCRATVLSTTAAGVDTTVSAFKAAHRRIKLGKLFRQMADGSEQWCYARCSAIATPFHTMDIFVAGLTWDYEVYSDWFDDGLTTAGPTTVTVSGAGGDFTVNNPGNLPAKLMTILVEANASGGYSAGFTLTNQTNGFVVATTRASASANDAARLVTGRGAFERSTDDGATWSDDFASLTRPTQQVIAAFELDPGDNTIRPTIGGTPNVDVTFTFYPHYA